jgi:hypothetical protein
MLIKKSKILRRATLTLIQRNLARDGYYEFSPYVYGQFIHEHILKYNYERPLESIRSPNINETILRSEDPYIGEFLADLIDKLENQVVNECIVPCLQAMTAVYQYKFGCDIYYEHKQAVDGFKVIGNRYNVDSIADWSMNYVEFTTEYIEIQLFNIVLACTLNMVRAGDYLESFTGAIIYHSIMIYCIHNNRNIEDFSHFLDTCKNSIRSDDLSRIGNWLTKCISISKFHTIQVSTLKDAVYRKTMEHDVFTCLSSGAPLDVSFLAWYYKDHLSDDKMPIIYTKTLGYTVWSNIDDYSIRLWGDYRMICEREAKRDLFKLLTSRGYEVDVKFLVYPFLIMLVSLALFVFVAGISRVSWFIIDGVDPTSLTSLVLVIEGLLLAIIVSTAARDWSWYDMIRGKIYYEDYNDIPKMIKPDIDLTMFYIHLMWFQDEYIKFINPLNACFLKGEKSGNSFLPRTANGLEMAAAGYLIIKKGYDYNITRLSGSGVLPERCDFSCSSEYGNILHMIQEKEINLDGKVIETIELGKINAGASIAFIQ